MNDLTNDLHKQHEAEINELQTSFDLKRALRGEFNPWTRIDYSDPSTFPEENRPCLVAWEWDTGHPDRHRLYELNDAGDDMRLWEITDDGDIKDWDGTDENPTHWMYAPEFVGK